MLGEILDTDVAALRGRVLLLEPRILNPTEREVAADECIDADRWGIDLAQYAGGRPGTLWRTSGAPETSSSAVVSGARRFRLSRFLDRVGERLLHKVKRISTGSFDLRLELMMAALRKLERNGGTYFQNYVVSDDYSARLATGGFHAAKTYCRTINSDNLGWCKNVKNSVAAIETYYRELCTIAKNNALAIRINEACGAAGGEGDTFWYIKRAEFGAGLYIGWKGCIPSRFRVPLMLGIIPLCDWLHFVPVKKGDYFRIPPGVPHGASPGIVAHVVESGAVQPFFIYDWARTSSKKMFDLRSERGIHNALEVFTRGMVRNGDARIKPAVIEHAGLREEIIDRPQLSLRRMEWVPGIDACHAVETSGRGASVTVLRGTLDVVDPCGRAVRVDSGRDVLVPSGMAAFSLHPLCNTHAQALVVVPKVIM